MIAPPRHDLGHEIVERMMNKREFLKAGGASVLAATLARPAFAMPGRRISIVQPHLPGAAAFAARQRAAGATVMAPKGDPVRWFRDTLRPALRGAEVTGFTDATHALVLEGSLREAGYARAAAPVHAGRVAQWAAARRA